MCTQQEFKKKPYPKDDVYDRWLNMLDAIEKSTISQSSEDRTSIENSLDIGYKLFPIIDSISQTIYGRNGIYYLKQLGYSDAEASVTWLSLRNGLLHGGAARTLFYNDGEVHWSIFTSSGSGGFSPHRPSDEYFPADKGIEYFSKDEIYHIWITYDRLVAHIKYDLLKRKDSDSSETIDLIIGEKINSNRRSAPEQND